MLLDKKETIKIKKMVEIKNISFSYGRHSVFNNVSLNLSEGKIYGLLGQNGVGKSTLLKILSGLIKLKSGECLVNGEVPFKREPSFLSEIYYLPEDFTGPAISIEEYAKETGKFYQRFSFDKFKEICSQFDVETNRKFTKLSYGQQKKAIIALAVSLNTKVLLMDEPSNGLDIPSKIHLRRIISQNTTDEQIVIISTHQVRDLENLIDPIIILDKDGVILNRSLYEISQKLRFTIEPAKVDGALYCEPALNGFSTVTINRDGEETQIDLEALFNCALLNKSTIKSLFGKQVIAGDIECE